MSKPYWPAVFTNPQLVKIRDERKLCADCLCGWANVLWGGNEVPAAFGEVVASAADRLGIIEAPMSQAFSNHARKMGWLK